MNHFSDQWRSQVSTVSLLLTMLTVGGIITACNSPASINTIVSEPVTDTQANLESLNVAVIPWQNSNEQAAKLQDLAAYLTEKLGLPVNIELTDSYDAAVDYLVNGEVQMASLGAFTYLQARERNSNVEPLVVPIDKNSGRPWYTSVMVVRTDSGIDSIEDTAGKRFSFVTDSSTSGFLVPSYNFKQIDLVPEEHFSSVGFSGGHNKSIEMLVAQDVDVIVTENLNFTRETKPGGALASGEYKIVWESEPIPNGPIVVSSQLPATLKLELQKALINAPEGLVGVSGAESAGYTVTEDADYQSIRELKQVLGL